MFWLALPWFFQSTSLAASVVQTAAEQDGIRREIFKYQPNLMIKIEEAKARRMKEILANAKKLFSPDISQNELKRLLAHGVDINSVSSSGNTPLHMSAERDRRRVTGLLVAYGAKVNVRDVSGLTPLHLAARQGHVKMVKFLLKQGANPLIEDRAGQTPVDLARNEFNDDLADLLESFSIGDLIADETSLKRRKHQDWVINIGGGGLIHPEYMGSDRMTADFYPFVDISWQDRVFLNISNGFGSYNISNGLGLHVVKTKNFILGTSLGYYESRDEDDSGELLGFGDIEEGLEFQLFSEYSLGALSFLNKHNGKVSLFGIFQHDITGSHGGWLWTGGMRHEIPLTRRIRLKADYKISWASEEYMETYFDVYPNQAATSTIVMYDAGAGIKDAGLGMGLTYDLDANWIFKGRLAYTRLLGDAQDSPLVDPDGGIGRDHQFQLGTAFAYRFQ